MYKKRIIKPPSNSKMSSDSQAQSKIIVNRTNSNKEPKLQKPIQTNKKKLNQIKAENFLLNMK